MVQSLLVLLLLLLLLGASASSMGSLDSSSGLAPASLNREKQISPARLSTRKLLDRTQYGICRRSRPSCDPLVNVTCKKGGSVGCWSCEMIQRCTPEAVGCYIHSMNNITYCGF